MAPILSVNSEQLNLWMVTFLWPFVRMLSLIGTAPVLSEAVVPRTVKLLIALLLAIVISPTLAPMPAVPVMSAAGIWILVQQILIGAAMGFSMRLVFAAVQAAGEYVGLQMGLSFASFFDPTSGGNTMVLSRLLNIFAVLIFLATDMHLLMIRTLAESFQTLPISDAPLARSGWAFLAVAGGQVVTNGLMLALPLIASLLSLNLAMGILNRVSPQFSIFSVGFPITLLAGLVMLLYLMQYIGPFLGPRFAASLDLIPIFLQGIRR
ncbi:MAG: flagellar biosynthetic protein FliR [Comamonadaceae bacterium CG_4_9_14_3_um_filter_60_33]|nr:MAG: flagellar biosynthetic protein FliR [Comamonadaceae bacterium CG_4_10_14_3_um_filter_60_42]PJB43640.1 MAG: flagellar biosynthetic protein FliR [Comamonadaceae bacterium CG_4_9_14_3_um_filter_60_33]